MGKNAGFWKKTGIALRKIFWDPWKKGINKNNSFGQNILTIGRNLAGTAGDLVGAAQFAMDALDFDRSVLGGKVESAMEMIGFGTAALAGGLNRLATGSWGRDENVPFLDSISGGDLGGTLEQGERFIQEVRDEYEKRFGDGNSFNSAVNQKPYDVEWNKASMFPGSRQQLTRPGARKELFNLQRPHWTTSQSKINKFGQK